MAPCTELCEEIALPIARLTHRGWSEFRNLKFQVDSEDLIPMWADKAQSGPLKDWSFCQVFVKLAKDHFKWYCDTRLQYVMWQFKLQHVERWLLNWLNPETVIARSKITTGFVNPVVILLRAITTPLHEPCALEFLGVSVHEFACTKSCHSLWCPVQESKWAACWRCLKMDLIFDIMSKRNPYLSSYNRGGRAATCLKFAQATCISHITNLDSRLLYNLFHCKLL